MNKVSKGLFLGSVGIGFGIATVLLILGNVQMRTGSPRAGLLLICLSCIPMLYGAIFMVVLWCKSWAAIQDGHARTTPGKAIGFLFIPLFDFYWVFQAVWGLSKDFNAYLQRNSIPASRLPEGLFLTYCILCFTTWIPILGLVLLVVNCIIAIIMVSALCDGINAVAATGLTGRDIRLG
ncbi:MAG: hypothetical protein ABSE93_19795 [Terriglobia bacterium]|jgi:hypothetical protein